MHDIIPPSELILNPDGSIYHLHLRPEHLASTVILVGDPDRVPLVSKYFDHVEHRIQKREFITHTGRLGNKRLSVLSTGIGTDNIDIVMNELDALVNIDLKERKIKEELSVLDFIRIGTSGSFNRQVGTDELLVSVYGIGIDCLLDFYNCHQNERESQLSEAFSGFSQTIGLPVEGQVSEASQALVSQMGPGFLHGITLSCPGFYGPQGRTLRLKNTFGKDFFDKAGDFAFQGTHLTNFEMETSGIYGMAKMLGHRAVSCNAIIANRLTNEFSGDPAKTVDRLIRSVLERLSEDSHG